MYGILLSFFWLFTLISAKNVSSFLETGSETDRLLLKRIAELRGIRYYINVGPNQYVDPDTGKSYLRGHGAIELEGTSQDGPLRFEIASDGHGGLYPRVLDLTTANTGKTVKAESIRKVVGPFDLTRITNKQVLDPETGDGIVRTITERDAEFRNGPGNQDRQRCCHDFVLDFIKEMGVVEDTTFDIPKDMQTLIDDSKMASGKLGFWDDNIKMDRIKLETASSDRKKSNAVKEFGLNSKAPPAESLAMDPIFSDEIIQPTPGNQPARDSFALDPQGNMVDQPEKVMAITDEKANLVRVNGEIRTLTSIGKDALVVLGVAGDIVGAVFVVLDFVHHNWVGGAIGAVGVAAGVAVGLLVEGPVGWVIGGLIALFTILPGLFKNQKPAAPITNATQILQRSFFGDKDHTGNEGCRKGTKDIPGNPDCQALYGPGTLTGTLKLNNFDAVVFLLQFNDGYPMTIPEMAANFHIVNQKVKNDGNNKIATIKCNNGAFFENPRYGTTSGDNPSLCNHPTYQVNRDLIQLPVINQTATNVYNRIIPATNGDCKILAYPGDQFFPSYNITLSGLPSAIACGLNSAINVSGIALPIAGDDNGLPTSIVSNGSQSTNGENIAYVAPPPKTPFQPLNSSSGYPCISVGTNPPICLPGGTYKGPSKDEIDLGKTDTLTMPSGGGWNFTAYAHKTKTRTFTDNQSPGPPPPKGTMSFLQYMQAVQKNSHKQGKFEIAGPDDGTTPMCCLFKEPSYAGDQLCVGVGGDDLPPAWSKKAQSISCHGGAWAWLYVKEYGDDGAALIQHAVPDLKDEPYGAAGGTFTKNVTAMWVRPGG